jgi:hypothetical protein
LTLDVSVCTGEPVAVLPAYTFTVTDEESPLRIPAVPLTVGVVLLVTEPLLGTLMPTMGAAVSTVNVTAELVPVLPAESVCVTCTVYWPCASAVVGTLYAPVDGFTLVVKVCTGEPVAVLPAYTFTVTDDESPLRIPAVPLTVGVVLLVTEPLLGTLMPTTGAVVSTVKVIAELVPVFPAESVCVTCMVY